MSTSTSRSKKRHARAKWQFWFTDWYRPQFDLRPTATPSARHFPQRRASARALDTSAGAIAARSARPIGESRALGPVEVLA